MSFSVRSKLPVTGEIFTDPKRNPSARRQRVVFLFAALFKKKNIFYTLFLSASRGHSIPSCPASCFYHTAMFVSLLVSLLGQVQCGCWSLSIMKSWEEEESTLLPFSQGMNYSPSGEEGLSTLRVCAPSCVSECPSVHGFTLRSSCTCGNVFLYEHSHHFFFALNAWFSLSVAHAK